jgi:hypothetical protein
MLGNECNWVRNVRAARGLVTIRHERARACHLVEIPVEKRASILKRYLQTVPGARPHVPVGRNAPLVEFEAIAARYPVFRVDAVTTPARTVKERKRHWRRWIIVADGTDKARP